MKTTYAIQSDATSGDTYALRYEGDDIRSIAGPLHYSTVRGIQDGTISIDSLEYEPVSGFFYDPCAVTWGAPVYTYDAEAIGRT